MGSAQSKIKSRGDIRASPNVSAEQLPSHIDWHDTILFVAPVTTGRVIKVYDGDTITVATRLPAFRRDSSNNFKSNPIYRFSVRLAGIDCPEIRSNDDGEQQVAKEAQEALSNLVLGRMVTLKNVNNEKYGRLLADVYYEDFHVNAHMVEQRFAVPYDGGTKNVPNDWVSYRSGVPPADVAEYL